MADTVPPYLHRHNYDGTFDSICTKCFSTIATSVIEYTLEDDEIHHRCSGMHTSPTIQGVNAQMDEKPIGKHPRSAA